MRFQNHFIFLLTASIHSASIPAMQTKPVQGSFRRCKTLLLADASFTAAHADIQPYIKAFHKVSDVFERQFNVSIQVSHKTDKKGLLGYTKAAADVSVDTVNKLLSKFLGDEEFCSIVVLTSTDFYGATVGISPVGSMCRRGANALIVSDNAGKISISDMIKIITHEIGHLFGSTHDGPNSCADGKFVMFPAVQESPNSLTFSPCSVRQIRDNLAKQTCLTK